jgi:hypothetical protein
MRMTGAQIERQQFRDTNGRYTRTIFRCELCGKNTGENYLSDPRCNRLGIGVTLCKKCVDRASRMSDTELEAAWRLQNAPPALTR